MYQRYINKGRGDYYEKVEACDNSFSVMLDGYCE